MIDLRTASETTRDIIVRSPAGQWDWNMTEVRQKFFLVRDIYRFSSTKTFSHEFRGKRSRIDRHHSKVQSIIGFCQIFGTILDCPGVLRQGMKGKLTSFRTLS
jgi:hypothetical protein